MADPALESLLPLPPAVFHILIALADRDRHGYSIMQDVADADRRRGAAQRRHALQLDSPHARAGPDRRAARQPRSVEHRRAPALLPPRAIRSARRRRRSRAAQRARPAGARYRTGAGRMKAHRGDLRRPAALLSRRRSGTNTARRCADVRRAVARRARHRPAARRAGRSCWRARSSTPARLRRASTGTSSSQDLRYALRTMLARPGFTAVAVAVTGARHRRQHRDFQPLAQRPPRAIARRPGTGRTGDAVEPGRDRQLDRRWDGRTEGPRSG